MITQVLISCQCKSNPITGLKWDQNIFLYFFLVWISYSHFGVLSRFKYETDKENFQYTTILIEENFLLAKEKTATSNPYNEKILYA